MGTDRTWAGGVRRAALAAGVGLAAAGAAPAQGPADPLDRVRATQAVADQRVDATVRQIVASADAIARTNPAQAVERLERARQSLDLTTAEISSAKRRELEGLIQGRISALRGRPAPAAPAGPAVDPRKEATRRAVAGMVQETRDVKEAVADVETAYAANNPAAAQARIADITRRYPNNPSVVALSDQGGYADRIAAAKDLARRAEAGTRLALNSVQESSIPAGRDVEFPKNWAEITKRRIDPETLLGPDEEAILRALEKQVGNPLKDAPFLETVKSLSNLVGKEIYLDRKSLEEAGLDLQRPVNMPGGVPARTALRAVLQAQGLTWVIREKLIQVVTVEKAQTMQVTRAYYLGEMVTGSAGLPGGAVVWGPGLDYQQTMANAAVIVDAIKQGVDPLIWKDRGGPATVSFHYPTMSLIVRAPAEVHASVFGRSRLR